MATNQIGVGHVCDRVELKVRPKLDQSFRTDQPLGIYLQFYNFKVDDKTHKNDASILIKVTQGDHEIARVVESGDQLNETGEQVTIHDLVPLSAFAPGQYHLEIQATDQITKQTISRSSDFTVKAIPASTSAQNAPGR